MMADDDRAPTDPMHDSLFHVLYGLRAWHCPTCGNEYPSLIDAMADHNDANCTALVQPVTITT